MKVVVLKDPGDDLFENLKSQYTGVSISSVSRQGNCWQRFFSVANYEVILQVPENVYQEVHNFLNNPTNMFDYKALVHSIDGKPSTTLQLAMWDAELNGIRY
jgi:hypothetical protein